MVVIRFFEASPNMNTGVLYHKRMVPRSRRAKNTRDIPRDNSRFAPKAEPITSHLEPVDTENDATLKYLEDLWTEDIAINLPRPTQRQRNARWSTRVTPNAQSGARSPKLLTPSAYAPWRPSTRTLRRSCHLLPPPSQVLTLQRASRGLKSSFGRPSLCWDRSMYKYVYFLSSLSFEWRGSHV